MLSPGKGFCLMKYKKVSTLCPPNGSCFWCYKGFSPVLSSRDFMVLYFTLRSMIHFDLIFVKGVRSVSRITFLYANDQLKDFKALPDRKSFKYEVSISFLPSECLTSLIVRIWLKRRMSREKNTTGSQSGVYFLRKRWDSVVKRRWA